MGPAPKGDREQFTFRLPRTHLAHYAAEAERAGFKHLSDYLVVRLAEAHGLDVPSYINRDKAQEQLPMPAAS
ncbi:MAG: hypothetical protein ACRCYU_24285 [Nocardioides sp.]